MYRFYFNDVLMPVTPSKLTVKVKGQNKTLTLANDGEVSFLRYPGLTEYNFDLLLPMLDAHYIDGDYHRPDYYLGLFEKLKTERCPFRFKVLRTTPGNEPLFNTDARVSLEDYDISESAKNGLDLSVSVNLKQYRDFCTKLVRINSGTVSTQDGRQTDNAPAGKGVYQVKDKDTLWSIARTHYGNGAEYRKIYEANSDKITDPNKIRPGMELILP